MRQQAIHAMAAGNRSLGESQPPSETAGHFQAAIEAAEQVLEQAPTDARMLLVLGQSYSGLGDPNSALHYLHQVAHDGSPQCLAAALKSGEITLRMGRLRDAEQDFLRVLTIDPSHHIANAQLALILGMQGRRYESTTYLFELLRTKKISTEELLFLGNTFVWIDHKSTLDALLTYDPGYPMPKISLAQLAFKLGDYEAAAKLARDVLDYDPQQLEAHVVLGKVCIYSGGAQVAFDQWLHDLPSAADQHPEIWFLRGRWLESTHPNAAARCYWEAVARFPDHAGGNYRLGLWLRKTGQESDAERFLGRAALLEELAAKLQAVIDLGPDQRLLRELSEILQRLGRRWEAWAWLQVAAATGSATDEMLAAKTRLEAELTPDTPRVTSAGDIAGLVDLSKFPLPDWSVDPSVGRAEVASSAPAVQHAVRLVDVAAAVSLDFTYFNGEVGRAPGERIYQEIGGGIGVLDFDLDGFPDVYLTQGTADPRVDAAGDYHDALFRNRDGQGFDSVVRRAGIDEADYGQGVAVGDFDQDGFPDLYVANIGHNRLYRNEGDGTFTESTRASELAEPGWTSSCLIADLNGDSLPDIYNVKYLAGDDFFERVCLPPKLLMAACKPLDFPAAADELWLNTGDGGVEDRTEAAGMNVPAGRGLGIVAADIGHGGQLSLFISNDTTANFFFANQTPQRGVLPVFDETGLSRGLALDRDGRAQASMGIAIDDIDNDGMFDLFITNFYAEANTLYRQVSAGVFDDFTQSAGLRDPGYLMLGFGAQFIDLQLDGAPDLVVANGHVNDLEPHVPFRMPMQVFVNDGAGQFAELLAAMVGDYFAKEFVGRSLARLDWNRDGKDDLVVGHLDDPVGLLENRTTTRHHGIGIQLRGVQCERDAFGGTVRVTAEGTSWTKQLTCGDGFQASNQRRLLFGLGTRQSIEQVEIRWPTGDVQVLTGLLPDHDYLVVQGRPEAIRMYSWPHPD